MKVIYKSDKMDSPQLILLEDMLAEIWRHNGRAASKTVFDALASRGWYEGVEDDYRYLLFVPEKFGVEPKPATHDTYAELYDPTMTVTR